MNQVQVLETPIKSEGDKKDYRLIKLPNGLKALLMRKIESSADNENLAAANVTIGVGSFDDPPKAVGLAHFLEHMVHMGSAKYPEESGYNDFLTANGGRRNAMTGCEYTSYYFNVSEKAFPEALDRLEQMIEAPLLLRNSMQREREAVDSEFQMQLSNDAARVQSILHLLVRETHPASQFGCGNLKTLKENITDDDLHSELMKLHGKYVGCNMFLTLQSKRTLDEMQELVVASFSTIKKGVKEVKPTFGVTEIFRPEFFTKQFFIKPTSPKKAMMLTWALPSLEAHYKCSPCDYISYVFKNEGEGGISVYLREKNLVSDILIHMVDQSIASNSQYTLVRLAVDLTDLGYENIDQILKAIYSYLLMLKETSIEDHRRLFMDSMEKTQNAFKFHNESSSMRNVMETAPKMLIYDDVDILRGSKIYQEFDEKLILDTIESLNQRDFNLLIISDKHETLNKKDRWFNTEYDERDFPEEYQRLWNNRESNPDFFLEKPNPFKTTNFEIFLNAEESPKYPVKILSDDIYEVWHKLDDKFKIPKVVFTVHLLSPVLMRSQKNFLIMKVFRKVLNFYLQKQLSQATNAGYQASIYSDDHGLIMEFTGYSDKTTKLIDIVTSFLPTCLDSADSSVLETIKRDMKETFNENLTSTYTLNSDYSRKILLDHHYLDRDLHNAVDDITLETLRDFVPKFFRHMKIQVMAHGNMTKGQVLKNLNLIQTNLNCEMLMDEYEVKDRCYQMPLGASVIRMKALLKNDDNSCIRDYYQIGLDTLRTRCAARLIVIILNPKAYDYLRSKEQLGYGVACQFAENGGIIGLNVIVLSQEQKHSYAKVCEKMEIFMKEVARKTIEEMTDEEFENFKDSRIKTLLAEDLDLESEARIFWSEIKDQEYIFNRKELAAKVTKELTKADLQKFFKSFMQPENMRKLSVQVIGHATSGVEIKPNDNERELNVEFITEKISEDENVFSNIEEFQRDLLLHPVVKFKID